MPSSSTVAVASAPLPVRGGAPGAPRRVPGATYRLQFHAGFTFRDAAALVPYLHALGITDCYCSSYLQAVPGSPHGYDVADPTALNGEIGSRADFDAFVAALGRHGMGQVLDIVPNHMGIARSANRWWQDVLENGASSRYARVFDIDWQPVKRELEGKVLLPILGDQYGAVLERQEIQLAYADGAFSLRYFETTLPLAPRSYARVLRDGLDALTAAIGEDDADVQELLSIITSLERLPERTETDAERLAERQREKEVAKRRLAQLTGRSEAIRRHVEESVARFNGVAGDARSFDALDSLLNDQAYRLAHWRVASEEINYRRFFDINELAAVRMEDGAVFDEHMQFVFELLAARAVTGLRIDHVDGLYDPGDYLRRLQARARDEGLGGGDRPLYVVVEKILAHDEPLPADWPVDGTTGYEFANRVNGLFVDGRNKRAFDEIYRRFAGERTTFGDLAYRNKKLIMQVGMASEINGLAHQLNLLSERNRHYRDFTLYSLAHAIREVIASFPVYRTYVPSSDAPVSERDRRYIAEAVEHAKRRNPAATGLVLDFIGDLLLKRADYLPESDRAEHLRFVTKFQQTTSPVTAKGVEDTALYIYNRLVSLNEVGGDPTRFGEPPEAVHAWLASRQQQWPSALSATSTHDTKRSEDVRTRLDALSEIPGAWKASLQRWSRANRRHRGLVDGVHVPDGNEEYFCYQALVGAWPLESIDASPDASFVERIQQYMVKALREAKRHTSWLNPNKAYEDAVTAFVARLLDPATSQAFLDEFRPLVARVARAGLWTSLAQTLIKIAAPGVPDFYQGTETWDFSLVDPDNRRPVDYERRRAILAALDGGGRGEPLPDEKLEDLVATPEDGRVKMYLVSRALVCRQRNAALFGSGAYVPLAVTGSRRDHVFAFARVHERECAIAIAPRLTAALVSEPAVVPIGEATWGDTRVHLPAVLSAVRLHDALSMATHAPDGEGTLAVGTLLQRFPGALLLGSTDSVAADSAADSR